MEESSLLIDVAVILLAAFPLLFLGRRLGIPEVLSYIVAGVIIGPHALGFIRQAERVDAIAELGVALILFFIGLHVPLGRIRALGRTAFVSGPVQMFLTSLAVAGITMLLGGAFRTGLFYGVLVALGSTAVVLPILTARDEMGAPFARRFLGVSLFQDLAVIPLMLLVPLFAMKGEAGPSMTEVVTRAGGAIAAVGILVLVARIVVPRLFRVIHQRLGRESFTGAAIVLIVGTIALTEWIGVSAALGAFAAGLVVGDTEFIHEIEGVLRPFRDFLSALFFTSIGMLLDPQFLFDYPFLILITVAGVIVLKVVMAYPAFRIAPSMQRTSMRAAFAIAPIGEFSFLLVQEGKRAGIMARDGEQTFVAVAVVTLAATPMLLSIGRWLSEGIHEEAVEEEDERREKLQGHIVIVGYGLNGQNVARVLASTRIPHIVLDEDSDRVALARSSGSRAMLADGADPHALESAGVPDADIIVVAISDPAGTRRIVRFCHQLNPEARIIVRTRYVAEVENLRALGAAEVIPEEFETSIEIVTRALRIRGVPDNIIANQLRLLRDEGYRMLRDPSVRATDVRRMTALFAAGTSQTFLVLPDSPVEGLSIEQLGLAKEGVAVAALLREGHAISPLPLDEPLTSGDTMLLVGPHADLSRAIARLESEDLRRQTSGAEPTLSHPA